MIFEVRTASDAELDKDTEAIKRNETVKFEEVQAEERYQTLMERRRRQRYCVDSESERGMLKFKMKD